MKKLLKAELQKIEPRLILLVYLVFLINGCVFRKDTCANKYTHIKINNKLIIGQSIDSLKNFFGVHFDSESSVPYDTTIVFLNHPPSIALTKEVEVFEYYTFFVGLKSNKILAFNSQLEFTCKDSDLSFSKYDIANVVKYIKENYIGLNSNIDSLLYKDATQFGNIKLINNNCYNYKEKIQVIDTFIIRNSIIFKYEVGDSQYIY